MLGSLLPMTGSLAPILGLGGRVRATGGRVRAIAGSGLTPGSGWEAKRHADEESREGRRTGPHCM